MVRLKDEAIKESFRNFLKETDAPWCWWCGRGSDQRSPNWHGPWLIERAHLVAKPRLEDRRVCVLLCSLCHKVSHGEWFPDYTLPKPTLAHLLGLKEIFDENYVDHKLARRCSIRRLPDPENPPIEVMREYLTRRRYPEAQIDLSEEE